MMSEKRVMWFRCTLPATAILGMCAALTVLLVRPATAGLMDGIIGYWPFNESSGNAADASGNGHAGTLVGNVTRADGMNGMGNALHFVNGRVNIDSGTSVPAQCPFNRTDQLSILAWISPDSLGGSNFGRIFSYRAGNAAYELYLTETNQLRGDVTGRGYFIDSSANAITMHAWNHVALTLGEESNGQVQYNVYVNGVLEATGTGPVPNKVASIPPATLGNRSSDGARAFDGLVDEVAFFGRELDAKEIAAVAGLGRFSGAELNDSGLDAVLDLDTPGQSALVGSHTWYYTDTFAPALSGEDLTAGMHYVGVDGLKYIILKEVSPGSFVGLVPEPGTWMLLAGALICGLPIRRCRAR